MTNKFGLLTIVILELGCTVYAEPANPVANPASNPAVVSVQNLTTPQNVNFDNCTKMFAINKEKLFYLTIASITANRFTIKEIQTANGYLIFSAGGSQYLATVAEIDNSDSILKVTPLNGVYTFPPGIITNLFKYIDLNLNKDIKD